MENRQTAVEWLNKQLEQYGSPSSLNVDWETLDQLIDQAKEIEKEQIIDAFYQCGKDNFEHIKIINRSAVEYYNETYGK